MALILLISDLSRLKDLAPSLSTTIQEGGILSEKKSNRRMHPRNYNKGISEKVKKIGFCLGKGQLISKANCQAVDSPKK